MRALNPFTAKSGFIASMIRVVALICFLTTSMALGAAEMVNINRADAATMIENWKGIGEVKARAIVAYRKKNGPFKSIEDLANVKGIGDGLLKNNRKLMSTSRGVVKPTGKAKTSSGQSSGKAASKQADSKKKSSSKSSSRDSKSTSSSSKKSTSTSTSSSKKKDKKATTSKKSKTKNSTSKKSTKKKKKPNT